MLVLFSVYLLVWLLWFIDLLEIPSCDGWTFRGFKLDVKMFRMKDVVVVLDNILKSASEPRDLLSNEPQHSISIVWQ